MASAEEYNAFTKKRNIKKTSIIDRIVEQLKDNEPFESIKQNILSLKEKVLKISEDEYEVFFKLALDRFSTDIITDRDTVIAQSIFRYENEIKRLLDEEDLKKKVLYRLLALDTMKDLEALIGFHRTIVYVKFKERFDERKANIVINDSLNLDSLSLEEKLDFLQLIEKSRVSDFELESIKTTEYVKVKDSNKNSSEDNFDQFELVQTISKENKDKEIVMIDINNLTKKIQENHLNNQ